jgi:hypothetical protein
MNQADRVEQHGTFGSIAEASAVDGIAEVSRDDLDSVRQ